MVLVALSADLVRTSRLTSAVDLLNRSIELDPTNPVALLALGATLERTGRYREAIPALRTLVEEHPDNVEGVLRLAVNLARTGDPEDAEGHFRQLIADDSPTWITVISYQELARLLPIAEAERILREAVERFPGNQALRVQLAFLLDGRGQQSEAGQLIDRLCRRAAPPETSPRVRYPAWPSLGLGEMMVLYQSEMEAKLPSLVMALDERASKKNRQTSS